MKQILFLTIFFFSSYFSFAKTTAVEYNYLTKGYKIQIESEHYAKRQMTWFQKDSRILWLKDYAKIEKTIQKFLH